MADVKVQVCKDGPVLVYGNIKMVDHDGTEIPVEKGVIALCRCGGSATKPFCDGAHGRNGFCGTLGVQDPATQLEAAE
jgi:CDGSH-type Zn-finger protein